MSSASTHDAKRSRSYAVLQIVTHSTASQENIDRHTSIDCAGRWAECFFHMHTVPSAPPV